MSSCRNFSVVVVVIIVIVIIVIVVVVVIIVIVIIVIVIDDDDVVECVDFIKNDRRGKRRNVDAGAFGATLVRPPDRMV